MPKATRYLLIWRAEQEAYELREHPSQRSLTFTPEEQAWFAWLETVSSFAFQGQQGQLTVRKESRQRGDWYWYGYHRVGRLLKKKYLGKSKELTIAHLEGAAALLTEAEVFPPSKGALHMPADETLLSTLHSGGEDTRKASVVPSSRPGIQLDPLLFTKLHIPHSRAQLVPRARLIERLQQGLKCALTLISAPAGFGKTTLLVQWLSASHLPSAWVSLESEDNEPTRFLSILIATLQQLDPHLGTSALARLHSLSPSPPPPPETVVALLVADLYDQQAPRDFVLVLDDYHVITSEALHHALVYLIEHAPPHLHLVIASRSDPALSLARLRAQGQLCEVRAAQLQFQTEETSAFFQVVMGLSLSVEQSAVLQSQTEGWIAGLQLAALSLQDHADVQQFLTDFTGSHRHVVDYLVEEVLVRQPEDVQSFLLRSSILDSLTGPLCDAVTGRSRSSVMLEHLEHANLFLIPLDEQRQWYRYHHLFAEVLRRHLQQGIGKEELASLYSRASAWYADNRMPAKAIEAALEAGDFPRVEHLIDEPLVQSMLVSQQNTTLFSWLERLPKATLFSRGFLCLAYVWSQFSSEAPTVHEPLLAVAEQLLQAEGNRKGLGQVYTLRTIAASVQGDTVQTIRHANQALELLPKEAILERSVVASGLAECYRLQGEVEAARKVLIEARPLSERSGNIRSMLGDAIVQANLFVMQGKLREAVKVYNLVFKKAGEHFSFASHALLGLGNIAREGNELDEAEVYLEQAFTMASATQEKVLQTRAWSLRARVIEARGEVAKTREAWTSAVMLAQECHSVDLLEQVQAEQVRYWLRQGQMNAVTRWQQTLSFSPDAPASYQQEVLALTLARVLIAQGAAAEALHLLERWQAPARAQGRTGSEIEILILSALAQQVQSKKEQAVQLLQQALILTAPEGYMRLFVDEGIPMIALLSHVLSRWKGKAEAEYVQKMLLVLHTIQGPSPFVTTHQESPIEPLTAREYKVLRGLAVGLSNAEIAAEQVVSINTIKTQVQSIYRKLNVTNRQEAVALAHYWRLL